jgi:uncharacterized protein
MKDYEKYLNEKECTAVALFATRARQFLGEGLVELKVFGSKVRGDFDHESDIDLLLIVKCRDARIGYEISKIAADINLELDCVLSPIIYTDYEYQKNCLFQSLFAKTVAQEGVPL